MQLVRQIAWRHLARYTPPPRWARALTVVSGISVACSLLFLWGKTAILLVLGSSLLCLKIGIFASYLRSRAAILCFAIALACLALTLVFGIRSGLQNQLLTVMIQQQAELTVRGKHHQYIANNAGFLSELEQLPYVKGVSPYLQSDLLLRSTFYRSGVQVIGVEPERYASFLGRSADSLTQALRFIDSPLVSTNEENIYEQFAPVRPYTGSGQEARIENEIVESEGWEDPVQELANSAVSDEKTEVREKVEQPPLQDSILPSAHLPGVVMSYDFAEELGVEVGDPVQLITPVPRITPLGAVPGVLMVRVTGLYEERGYDFGRNRVYIRLEQLQNLLKCRGQISGMDLRLRADTLLESARQNIQKIVEDHGYRDDLLLISWMERHHTLFSITVTEKIMLSTILTCIAMIAGFGILASQWTAVLERTHEIAILQTLGCRWQNIGQIFLLEGLFLATIATLLGIGAGLILLRTLSQIHLPLEGRFFGLEFLPVHIDPLQYLFLGISAFCFVWGASVFSAWKATRIHPVWSLNNSNSEK